MKEWGYAESLKEDINMEIQSYTFVFNITLPIEGITYEYHNKDHSDVSNEANIKMEFHSHFSDESAHN